MVLKLPACTLLLLLVIYFILVAQAQIGTPEERAAAQVAALSMPSWPSSRRLQTWVQGRAENSKPKWSKTDHKTQDAREVIKHKTPEKKHACDKNNEIPELLSKTWCNDNKTFWNQGFQDGTVH
jgi:hypothetical protein